MLDHRPRHDTLGQFWVKPGTRPKSMTRLIGEAMPAQGPLNVDRYRDQREEKGRHAAARTVGGGGATGASFAFEALDAGSGEKS